MCLSEDKQDLSIHGFKRKLKKKLRQECLIGVVKRDMVEKEERKQDQVAFWHRKKMKRSLLVQILPGWHLEGKADKS